MEKEKAHRKRSLDNKREHHHQLPTPPPDPTLSSHPGSSQTTPTDNETDPFKRLSTYKDRELVFLKLLNESDNAVKYSENVVPKDKENIGPKKESVLDSAFESHSDFLTLLNRTGPSVAAALSTKGAIDQLDKLHSLIKQLLTLQEENMRMHRTLKTVETLQGLKNMQNNLKTDTLSQNDDEDLIDTEFEQNMALLETILAAGNSASSKRNSSKRQRSKSVIHDDIAGAMSSSKDGARNYPLRRQSAIVDFKPKVSKWTKVKAAFKWEKTSALSSESIKNVDPMIPNNHEMARYLRVPSIPCVGSSADSVLSSSSGVILSGGSVPDTPGENSLASSLDDLCELQEDKEKHVKRDSVKSNDLISHDEDARRSRSLDGETILESRREGGGDKGKNKSAWSKVKGIVKTHRGSLKSNSSRSRSNKLSNSVGCSREASPCDSVDAFSNDNQRERSDSFSSNQTSPSHRNTTPTFLSLPGGDNTSCPNSPSGSVPTTFSSDDTDNKSDSKVNEKMNRNTGSGSGRSSRKSKHIPEIESVPEGVPIDTIPSITKIRKSPPKPLNLKQESMDFESLDQVSSPNSQKFKNIASPPGSPCRHYEFFQFDEDLSSGDISDPGTPHRRVSPKTKSIIVQREEIKKRYMELQKKLQQEFEVKQQEWERIRPSAVLMSTSPIHAHLKDETPSTSKAPLNSQPNITEENLPPDFKKKLTEWRSKHQQSIKDSPAPSPPAVKEVEHKKKSTTDWQLWKTGQVKLEGQGLKQLPDAKDLPEEFQKKLSEWKQMKAANKVPSYTTQCPHSGETATKRQSTKTVLPIKKSKTEDFEKHKDKVVGLSHLKALVTEPPKKDVVVQTTKGFIKFEGISRKFTRKLFEWEKARGIGPEASTFALLHPGYAPVVVENGSEILENKREKSPGLQRSMSMDSVSPNPSVPSISHQPSSLSLNDADELKESSEKESRRVSSNPELEISNDHEEPEAVIVEVEDDITEAAQNKNESGNKSGNIIKGSTKLLNKLKEEDHFDRKEVKHLKVVLRALIDTLPDFIKSQSQKHVAFLMYMKNLSIDIFKLLNKVEESQEVVANIVKINSLIVELKKALHKYTKIINVLRNDEEVPEISITPAIGAQAVASIQSTDDSYNNMATICVTPTFVCNAVRFDEVEPVQSSEMRMIPISSESEHVPNTSQSQDSSNCLEEIDKQDGYERDKSGKKLTRNLSNESRKKTRIRRMGSRQNSKTESDSDENPPVYVLDAPRKTKRKTSRAKKTAETSDKSQNDDIVFVLKIRPGQKIEQIEKQQSEESKEVVEQFESCSTSVTTNVLIKTKRKIFTTVEGETNANGNSPIVVSQDIESSSTSDKNDMDQNKLVTNLPPLPQSPSTQRRLEQLRNSPRDLSPNIRIMIAKYNQKLSTEKSPNSPHSSGSCSPVAWRSPVLDRRVRKQTEKYQESIQLTKSASAGSLRKSSKTSEDSEKSIEVVKSSSAGALILEKDAALDIEAEGNSPSRLTFLAYDSLRRRDVITAVESDSSAKIETVKKERLYKKRTESPVPQSKGAVKKVLKYEKYTRCRSAPEGVSSNNTAPRIIRKHHGKPPSPQLTPRYNPTAPSSPMNEEIFAITMSQRALKLKKAKEEFLKTSHHHKESEVVEAVWHNRISQISTVSGTSTEEAPLVKKSVSAGVINSSDELNHESGYASLPRNSSGRRSTEEDKNSERRYSQSPRFGLSNIASKLRKVKLRRSSKDLSKMETVSYLCRQSLMVDITGEALSVSEQNVSAQPLRKSGSVYAITSRFRRRSSERGEELKKSHSLGFLKPE